MQYPDTGTYLHLDFLGHGGDRLWTVPLLYNVLADDRARTLAQLLIGILSWSALAFAVAASLQQRIVARVGAALVLLLGLCIQVTEWDVILLSESLALSLTALLVATLLWVWLQPTRWRLAALVAVLAFWVFNRQLQAVVFVLIAVVAIVWILLRRRRFVALALALAILAAWAGYATANSVTPITRENAHDILVLRLFTSPENVTYFKRRGMPQIAALTREAATGSDKGVQDPVYRNRQWQRWIDAHWSRTYVGLLLRHPVDDLRGPLSDARNELSGYPAYAHSFPALPGVIQDALWEREIPAGDVFFFVVVTSLLWLASLRFRRVGGLDAFGGLLLAATALWYFAGWHWGAIELQRIFVPVAASLRIGLLVVALAAVDRLCLGLVETAGSR